VLLAVLVAAAPLADSAGAHALAFWVLVAAVPPAAVCALASFGAFLDDRNDAVGALQAFLWGPAIVLLLAGAAARGPAVAAGDVPRLGVTAAAGCLGVLALKAAIFAGTRLLRGRPGAAPLPTR
jgi:hypothetical protein